MEPKYGQEDWVTACDHLKVIASWSGGRAPTRTETCVYNPLPGWAIVEHKVVIHSSNNGRRSVQVLGGASHLITQSELKEAYDTAIDLAVDAGKYEAAGKLQQQYSQHSYERSLYAASHNTLVAKVSATPHGWFLDRKRGWEEISVFAHLRYLGAPGSKYQVLSQLRTQFGL